MEPLARIDEDVLEPPAEPAAEGGGPRWSPALRVAFRFFFSYFVLLLGSGYVWMLVPYRSVVYPKYAALCLAGVTWIARHVLHTGREIYLIEGAATISNSAFGTILCGCYLALAGVATVVWSVLDRRRLEYRRLHAWFRLLLRLALGLAMINYGTFKTIPAQMVAPPPLSVLTQRVGELTRMRMLWISMGASPQYETFTGLAELLGGVLLLVPWTVRLGALVCVADMMNVFVLNMTYDVQVKLYSFHLLAMGLLLAAPDLPRLANLLLFNRRVEPAPPQPLSSRKWLDRVPHVLLLLLGLYAIGAGFGRAREVYGQFHPPQPPLYGVWNVEEYAVDGKEVPPSTDPQGWRSVLFQKRGSITIERSIGSWDHHPLELDLKRKTLRIGQTLDPKSQTTPPPVWRSSFALSEPEEDVLVLDGWFEGHRTHVKLRQAALLRRGFHWIFELPPEDRDE
jgi:uncharacterized membrane protein YphA (DoxX/SURF4 family)